MPDSSQAFLRELDKKLWTAADRLRSNLDAAVYSRAERDRLARRPARDGCIEKNIFRMPPIARCKTLQDSAKLPAGTEIKERGRLAHSYRIYCTEKSVFRLPPMARWQALQDSAKLPPGTEIKERGRLAHSYKFTSPAKPTENPLEAVEKENPKLKNVLNKTHTHLQIDPANLPRLIDLIATLPFQHADRNLPRHSAAATAAKDLLGPDPESSRSNSSSAPLGDLCAFAVQNSSMAIRGIDFDFAKEPAGTFTRDQHPDLGISKAELRMSN